MEEKLKNLKVGMKLRTGFKNIMIGMLLIVLADGSRCGYYGSVQKILRRIIPE